MSAYGFAVHDEIVALSGLAPAAQKRALDRIFAQLLPELRLFARRWCRSSGDLGLYYVEDIVQETAEELLVILRQFVQGTAHQKVAGWDSYLYRVAERKAHRFFISSAVTPLSGRTAVERRARKIRRTVAKLSLDLGHMPAADDVVEVLNADARSRRANPEKQGALVSQAEVRSYLS